MTIKRNMSYVILSLFLLGLWEYQAQQSNIVRLLISSPSLVIDYFIQNTSILLRATWVTFYEAMIGLLLAVVFSFTMMTLCFYHEWFMNYILPVMVISQVIPLITLAPLFIILFGIGATAKIMMAAVLCFFPIFVSFANGVRLINKNIHELFYLYDASKTQKIRFVYFPLAMPSIMAGLKVSATLAVIGAIVAEFNGAQIGLGKNLFLAAKRLEPDLMMASLLLSSALGGLMFCSIYLIEKQFGKWYTNL